MPARSCSRLRGAMLAVVSCSSLWLFGTGGAGAADSEGAKLFIQHKCNLCHAVQSAGIEATVRSAKMKGPDLGGTPREATWMAPYLRKQSDLDGKTHLRAYKGSEADLEKLVAWLAAQKRAE